MTTPAEVEAVARALALGDLRCPFCNNPEPFDAVGLRLHLNGLFGCDVFAAVETLMQAEFSHGEIKETAIAALDAARRKEG